MNDSSTEDFELEETLATIEDKLKALHFDQRISAINGIKEWLHSISPFASEPVDCVIWVKGDHVEANDYNPNTVAPPEMRLLELSVAADGFTQPVVAWDKTSYLEVVDGFHRTRVAKECDEVKARLHGYIPVTVINDNRSDRGDRIASTIRHNRARGKHGISAMSDIVVELKRRNWNDNKIAKELGMDPDEVLRLSQISGLIEMFSDRDFSEAWEAEDPFNVEDDADMD